jgi:outer membrane protein OmpA-like peptidoglycan-associated protein
MNTHYYTKMCKQSFKVIGMLTGLMLISSITGTNGANTLSSTTESSVLTEQQILAQEIDLKAKQLEYEKALLVKQQSEELTLRKGQLEIEIKKLELLKARRDLMIMETEQKLDMLVEGDVLFDVNSSEIKLGAAPSLRQVAIILSEYPKGTVTVTGFADSTGTAQSNLELSRNRAESVKTYLLEKAKGLISSERVVAQGKGEAKPVATNANSSGRQLNRRVEITINKI